MFPNRVPNDRDSLSPEPLIYSFIHVYVPESQKGTLLHIGKNIRSPSTEPHADGRPTYNGVWSDSPRGSLMALLSLLLCQAAFSKRRELAGALLVVVWQDNPPDHDQQRSSRFFPTVKPEAPSAVVRS